MTRHRRNQLALASLLAGTGLALLGQTTAGAAPVEGNPSCADVLPGSTEFKIDQNPSSGTYNGSGGLVVNITNNGDGTFSWSSNEPINALIVKGGPNANVTVYPGGATAGSGSTLVNPNNEQLYGISHVSFCQVEQPTTTTTVPDTTTTVPETTTTVPETTTTVPETTTTVPETTTTVPETTTTVPETTTTVPETTTTTEVEETTTPEPEAEVLPVVVTSTPEVEAEVLGAQQEREALPRTGTTSGALTAAGVALLATGTALVRRGRTVS